MIPIAQTGEEDEKPEEVKKRSKSSKKSKNNTDRVYSADYACSNCAISFIPPTPQMFSFNSPQGMCDGCDGLGRVFTFDPGLLLPDTSRSFQQGCIELLGKWADLLSLIHISEPTRPY